MSEHLEAAAAAIGAPADLVEKSAIARAAASGTTVEEVLAAWAGGGTAPTGAAPATTAPTPAAEPTPTDTSSTEAVAPEPTTSPDAAPVIAQPPAAASPVTIQAVAIPETVSIDESMDWDMVTSVGSAGLKEKTRTVIPSWLVGFFVIIPLFAIGYLFTGSDSAVCGEAGQLAVDFRNDLVNCDLSAYEGFGGPGSGTLNYVALGSQVYATNCASCHGPDGGGIGTFPRLSGGSVLETFGQCSGHLSWVGLGSSGWVAQNGPTYGDTNNPSVGGMPAFGAVLTPDELAAAVMFERVVFGGADTDEALVDCGLVVEETEPEEAPADGEPVEESTEAAALR